MEAWKWDVITDLVRTFIEEQTAKREKLGNATRYETPKQFNNRMQMMRAILEECEANSKESN